MNPLRRVAGDDDVVTGCLLTVVATVGFAVLLVLVVAALLALGGTR